MKIGVHSDLHSECSLCTISNLAELDVLVLAGDIGDPTTVPLFSITCGARRRNCRCCTCWATTNTTALR